MRVVPAGRWGMPSVDRTAITPELASRLIGDQLPQWAGLPVRRVEPGGRDNITFRPGPDMSVRLPSGPGYVEQVEKEHRQFRRDDPAVVAGGLSCRLPCRAIGNHPHGGMPGSPA
jgi:hypothetical protein